MELFYLSLEDNMNDDWRISGQEKYLENSIFRYSAYKAVSPDWEHDHCECCNQKLTENTQGTLHEGYVTLDDYHWVCSKCFIDFKDRFEWVEVDPKFRPLRS